MSNFFSLEIGKRSVLMHQTALSITGHNMANANTPGYTRQVPDIVTTPPWHAPALVQTGKAGQLGTGVDIAAINRIRDEFIDNQIRHENRTDGYWSALQDTLAKIEVILNEPSEDGLRGVMDMFWESWQNLSIHPESEAVRAVVVQRGMSLAEAFNHTYRQLVELREDVNAQVKVKVDEINSIAMQVADLNQQILAISIAGKQPNDLLDKRDLLIDQLSKIADIRVYNDRNNMVALQLGDRVLVEGVNYNKLSTQMDQEGMNMVIWQDTGTRVNVANGELRGLLDARGKTLLEGEAQPSIYKETIPNMIDKLNALAKTLVVKVNNIHRGGYSLNNKTDQSGTPYIDMRYPDGIDFFDLPPDQDSYDNWAKFMRVSQEIQNDPKNIAAACHRTWDDEGNKINFGDGNNALKIAQLKHDLNNVIYDLKTNGISIDISSTQALEFLIDAGSGIKNIQVPAPRTYEDMRKLADAIQEELDKREMDVKVRLDGDEIFFYSTSVRSLEVIDPLSGIRDLQVSGLQNGEYQIDTIVNQPGARDAELRILQSYNQRTAANIFGSAAIGSITNASTLGVNASIELSVTNVNSITGRVEYSYISHEYALDGNYSSHTGTLSIYYGGSGNQIINIGSLEFELTGLDTVNAGKAAELKVGDKGVLNLTAATAAAITYQQLDLKYNYNLPEPENRTHHFVFSNGVLNDLDVAIPNLDENKLHFFTLNNNPLSQYCGMSYDGHIKLTTGTIADGTSPATHFSHYQEPVENLGMVHHVTTDDYWRSIAADTGVQSQEARRMVKNQETLLNELENKRQSISGVSLDEEMTNMIKFQHAYNAAARFITSIDEALEVIISRMGLVGR
ncbi:MAG: flagellar hook-associated protein FlgK [Syntrophomonadaceae bacterium]|nr:flagellar hook-associated protein FlgK [Syntrophomonadaceae bacterium]